MSYGLSEGRYSTSILSLSVLPRESENRKERERAQEVTEREKGAVPCCSISSDYLFVLRELSGSANDARVREAAAVDLGSAGGRAGGRASGRTSERSFGVRRSFDFRVRLSCSFSKSLSEHPDGSQAL